MKYLKDLFFDKKMVVTMKQANVDSDYFYYQLFSGRITLQEYLHATK